MTKIELNQSVDNAYQLIEDRINLQKQRYEEKNIRVKRISFEDVSLEDILESVLLPLLPELIEKYASLELKYRWKCYRVYIGTLCEIVKNGLVNGGILKTMDARIGVFDRNHHYALLKDALEFEGIEIIDKHRKYEETIINEAGIPRGYHKKCIEFFRLYWKWLHNFDSSERESFLRSYLNFEPLTKVYIIDHTDLQRLNALRQDTQSFSEKVIKTCQKFERVFTAIDSYPEAISEANIETVAAEISSIVGFDIFSVVRSSAVKQYILDYARKVSFAKFDHIKKNLPDSENIVLPNGKVRKNNEYSLPGFIGGIHRLRGNAYEVSFPIALSIEDYYSLDLQKPLIYGNSIVYTSDEPIEAEVDGFARPHRTFYDAYKGVLYVFYERIAPGSYVYLDGIPVQEFAPFSRKTYICKYWDSQEKHYKLAFCIDYLKYASSNNSMRKVSLSCKGVEIIHGQTNSNGSYRLIDKLIPLEDIFSNDGIQLEFTVNNERIESWRIEVSDFYMWGKQSGLRVYSEIDLSKWYGPSSVIVFSKEEIYDASFPLEHLYDEQGYHVYEGVFDKTADAIVLLGKRIAINKPTQSFIELLSDYDIYSEKICVSENVTLAIKVHNLDKNDNTQILQIEHDNEVRSYNLLNLSESDLENVYALLPLSGEKLNYVGGWSFTLYKNDQRISELYVEVLPKITIRSSKAYYAEGEEVTVEVCASGDCFEQEGDYVDSKKLQIGTASVAMTGNLVHPKPIDFDCYFDKCGVVKRFSFVPNTWGLKMKDLTTDMWMTSCLTSLTFEELKRYGVFVCSTVEMSLSVSADDDNMKRMIRPGYNKVNLKQLLWDFEAKKDVVFTDSYNQTRIISVLCPTRITTDPVEYAESTVVIPLRYFGPINTTLDIRVYSGRNAILSITRDVYHNSFRINLYIDRSRIKDPNISIEARVGTQDYQQIMSAIVDLGLLKDTAKVFEFTENLSLLELLSHSMKRQDKAFPYRLIALLEQGGAE